MKKTLLILAIVVGSQVLCHSQTNTFPSSGNVGIGTTAPAANLSFHNLNDGRNTPDGITWYNPGPLAYGIHRTAGAWSPPNYQQLRLSWDTGIELFPGSLYGKSYVDIQGGGLRVSSGDVGIGTTSPLSKLDVRGNLLLEVGGHPSIYTGSGTSELNRYLWLLNSPSLQNASGLKVGGVLVSDSYYYANPGKNDLVVKGKIGLGTPNPDGRLEINSAGGQLKLSGGTVAGGVWTSAGDALYLADWNTGTKGLNINMTTGSVGIGTFTPGSYKLAVEGKIGAREVNVTTTAWADHVFKPDYNLRPLSEVQQFISEHHHLPDVPSENEVLKNGQNLGEMNAILLKKIEELTLYLIELKAENEQLSRRLNTIEKKEKSN